MEAPQSKRHANDEYLCDLCVRALTIDDQLAGGAKSVNPSDGATSLELSGLRYNDWRMVERVGPRTERLSASATRQNRDAHGWVWRGCHGPRQVSNQWLFFCAGDHYERCVRLPRMLEISEPATGTCRLCSRLRALFTEQYEECSWWLDTGSALKFTIQYEWSEWRSVREAQEQAQIPHRAQLIDGLAVLVFHPGLESDRVDVFQFEVVAWPGRFHRFDRFQRQLIEHLK